MPEFLWNGAFDSKKIPTIRLDLVQFTFLMAQILFLFANKLRE